MRHMHACKQTPLQLWLKIHKGHAKMSQEPVRLARIHSVLAILASDEWPVPSNTELPLSSGSASNRSTIFPCYSSCHPQAPATKSRCKDRPSHNKSVMPAHQEESLHLSVSPVSVHAWLLTLGHMQQIDMYISSQGEEPRSHSSSNLFQRMGCCKQQIMLKPTTQEDLLPVYLPCL